MREDAARTAIIAVILLTFTVTTASSSVGAAPKIGHRPPMSISAGTPLKINMSVSDSVKIENVMLNYRHAGEKENKSLSMKRVGGNDTDATFEATIDEKDVTAGYIFYTFNITDEEGYTISPTYTASVNEESGGSSQFSVFIMAMVVAIIFIILEIGLKYRHI